MIGAILGDMIGSPYEFDLGNKSKEFPLFSRKSVFTDDKIDTYNIFDHSSFHLYVKKAAKKCQTKDEFAKNLRSELMYYFWSKCEWEVLISPWISSRENEEMKIDVCWQVMNNWDVFLDYVWNNKRKL